MRAMQSCSALRIAMLRKLRRIAQQILTGLTLLLACQDCMLLTATPSAVAVLQAWKLQWH